MNNNKPDLTIKKDLYKKQQDIITSLREENAKLQQRVNILEETAEEYRIFKSSFSTSQTTYSQAMQAVLTVQNAEVQRRNKMINQERQAARELAEAEKHDADVKAVLNENPDLQKYADERKTKVKATKDKMLQLVNRFYDMSSEQLRQYVDIPHKNTESAVKHLLLLHEPKHQDEEGGSSYFTYEFECRYCNDISYNLDEFERHCYLQQSDHRQETIDMVESEARADISKIHKEYLQDIELAIKSKQERELKERRSKEQAEQRRTKQSLPFCH